MESINNIASNKAALLVGNKVNPLKVDRRPYTQPREGQITIRNHAVAINPVDRIIQESGNFAFSWIKYPWVLGSDCAGEVVEVGPRVSRFKVGDRVVGHAAGLDKERNSSAEGAFQQYTVLLAYMTAPIPDTLSYEKACVIPLGASTAACGLFQSDQLNLKRPSLDAEQVGQTLIIWGGSTSVGCNAIQLAVAAGYEVFTTSSPKNFLLCKSLGASQVFDYKSSTVVQDMINALKGKTIPGALAIGQGSADACLDVISKCQGTKFVSVASFPIQDPPPENLVALRTVSGLVTWFTKWYFKTRLAGVKSKLINGTDLVNNGVGKSVYEDFLGGALARGSFQPAPEPQIVGRGLDKVQEALTLNREGVSAKKLVVML